MKKIKKIGLLLGLASVCLAAVFAESSKKVKVNENGAPVPYKVLAKTKDKVEIRKGGFGSDASAFPGDNTKFYLVTDRGPNIDYTGPDGKGKMFPVPEFNPEIGLFQFTKKGEVKLIKTISLKNPDGKKLTGLPNPKGMGATGELGYDLKDNIVGIDEYGIDIEGLAAMSDGTFWVSDEYGPHIAHYSKDGIELERMSPFGMTTKGRKIPAVFAKRRANRGMEGLTKTPDEKYLVGIMQSTMFNPSKSEIVNKRVVRILKFELATGNCQTFLYQQNEETDSCCGIEALSNDEFLVIERDSKFPTQEEAHKYINRISLKDATDVTGDFEAENGLLIDGKTLEQCTQQELIDAGIVFVKKEVITDLVKDRAYKHEKLESIWLLDENTFCVANDNDFALIVKDNKLCQKILGGDTAPEDNVVYPVKF
ncbi:MAG: esterase-like activity of phytase family protein [Treponema sp.]|nr:esterase-like activity of phytase family protein [Treponema sp.]